MKIAILGAGSIARTMAYTMDKMDDVECYAVAARDHVRAKLFADEFGFEHAYGSYEAMVTDPEVELVYIATPHSYHHEHTRLCLTHGKHVLCEKAFMATAWQAEEVIQLARSRKLLLAEAIWTRYMPMRKILDEVVASGIIGDVYSLTANLGYVINHIPRLADPALAGGALLDVGVYPIHFASMLFKDKIKHIASSAVLTEEGVDAQNNIAITYEDGKMAVLHSSMMALTDRQGVIHGNKGFIAVKNINNCEAIEVYDLKRNLIQQHQRPPQITGLEYQVEACIKAIRSGEVECPQMPHSEIIRISKLLDQLRETWGASF
ncbi:Gfo/Idh/MocA family protein [Psychromonas sp.]|uniref:Gfo/Idh/MocA family protein n=1 Tax=Psychromonas sp. TaxID=1884585 RepID=UPI003561A9A8